MRQNSVRGYLGLK